MYHYTYKLTFPSGMQYIGLRSCKWHPTLDETYLGTGRALPSRSLHSCTKEILAIFPSRELARAHEISLIDKLDCVCSPTYYNLKRSTTDLFGRTSKSHEHVKNTALKNKGRTKHTHEYLALKGKEFSEKYTGESRTPALKRADANKLGKSLGSNPLKGHSGISNCAFVPWYFVKPSGEITIVSSITKQDYAAKLGITPRQMQHRFHYTNIGLPAKQGPMKGWIFGHVSDLETGEV